MYLNTTIAHVTLEVIKWAIKLLVDMTRSFIL